MDIEGKLVGVMREVGEMEERLERIEMCAKILADQIRGKGETGYNQIIVQNEKNKEEHCLVWQLLNSINERG